MTKNQAMADAKHTPEAVKTFSGAHMSNWRVTLSDGRVYVVATYPRTALIYVENEHGRKVNVGIETRDEIRAAIAKATGSAE